MVEGRQTLATAREQLGVLVLLVGVALAVALVTLVVVLDDRTA